MIDFKTAENHEILNELEASIRDFRPFLGLTECMKRVSLGTMPLEEFKGPQILGKQDIYPQMIASFKNGEYFGQQGLDFLSCLMLKAGEVKLDEHRWNELEGAAKILELESDPDYLEVKAFAESHVTHPYSYRARFIRDGGLCPAEGMDNKTRDAFEIMRDEFQTVTEKWGWKII